MAIRARCNVICSDKSRVEFADSNNTAHRKYLRSTAGLIDVPLFEVTESERRRQRQGMVTAMQRMVALVYSEGS